MMFLILLYSCDNSKSNKSRNNNPDSCFVFYKNIYSIDHTFVSDSIFMNCTNKSLLYHKLYYSNGQIRAKSYYLNNEKQGQFLLYDTDRTVIINKKYSHGIEINN